MTRGVAELRHEEVVRFDARQLEALCRERGDEGAELAIVEALTQGTQMLSAADVAWRAGDWSRLDVMCQAVGELAHRIGMTTLTMVARDVRTCIEQGDTSAVAATMMRLKRLGDNSAHAIWSLEEVSP